MTKKICWISDFDTTSSGYANISIPICDKLGKRGYDVKAIGLGYDGREHNFEFSILPVQSIMEAEGILANLQLLWKPDILIVALDIPYHGTLLNHLKNKGDMKYIGIMPIEGDPLCISHAMILMQMDKALVISEFGTKEAEKVGVTAEHLQIGIDTDSWRIPTPQEKSDLRKAFGIDDSTFVVLTVAENQERKNLSTGLEIFAEFAKDKDTKYIMVTREHSRAGWILTDLAQELHVNDKFTILEKGMPFGQLWSIYAMADVFFLPSKAEGLGMPILEAMAVGVPVVGTQCTAIGELLGEKGERGYPVEWIYTYRDPFGNQNRYFIDNEAGAEALEMVQLVSETRQIIIDEARRFVEQRTWEHTVDQVENTIKLLIGDENVEKKNK